jgi:ankyrin repeat protein
MSDPFDLIGKGDLGGLRAALSANPGLARTRALSGASLLAHAAYIGNRDAIEIIRAADQTLDPYEAIILGDADRVGDLLANHWDANERSPDGFTPLGLAAFFRHEEIFDLLLPLTTDVDAQATNPQKVAALHAATAQRQAGMVEKLLRAGANPDLRQADGFTPLHSAAFHGDAIIAGLLLLFGADPRATNDKGETAADLARSKGHDWLARRLEAPG